MIFRSHPMPRRLLSSAALCALLLTGAFVSPSLAETAGVQAMARGDYVQAVKQLSTAAKAGDPQAQLDLGLLILEGNGANRDPAQAAKWLRMAAEKNLPEAQYQLGLLLDDGQGVEKNKAEAAEWFRKAAQAGNMDASSTLAEMYLSGDGVPKDEGLAARFFQPAADQNDIDSQLALGKLYQQGLGVPKSFNDASVWFRKAAQLGSPEGRYQLAMLLLDSDPSGRNAHAPSQRTVEALKWLDDAAQQNYAPALYVLGMGKLNGIEAPLDISGGMALLQQAADQSHAPSLAQLGHIYLDGKLAPQDQVRGLMYLELAARGGDKAAARQRDDYANSPALPQARKRAQEWLDIHGL
jgi:hypothetical protein